MRCPEPIELAMRRLRFCATDSKAAVETGGYECLGERRGGPEGLAAGRVGQPLIRADC